MPLRPKDSVKLLYDKQFHSSKYGKFPFATKSDVFKLPSIHPLNATDEIKWQVKSLPTNWEPNTTPSNVVENLIKRKEIEHEECLKKMNEDRVKVNIDIEHDIRIKSEILKQKMEEKTLVIEEAMKWIQLPQDINLITIEKSMFDRIMKIIEDEIASISDEIIHFYSKLLELEKERSQRFKNIFKNYYEELLEISYKLPKQLQEYFEMEILNINQITLSNFRAYEELKMQIMLKVQNDRRIWIQCLLDRKDEYISLKNPALRDPNIKMVDGPTEGFCEESANRMRIPLVDKDGNIVNKIYINKLSHRLATLLINFNVDIKIMKSLIDEAIKKICTSRYDEIQNINIDVAQIQSDYLFIDMVETIRNTFYDDNGRLSFYTLDKIAKWDDFKVIIQNELLEKVKIFIAAVHLWDEHFHRIYELKELTLLELEKLMEKNSNAGISQLCKCNMLIDTLRQASNEEELTKTMAEINKILQNIRKVANVNKAKEADFFKKYKGLAQNEASIFIGEVDSFLNHYAKSEDVDPTIKRVRASRLEISSITEDDTPSILKEFENMAKSLKNWIFGLQDGIESSVEKFYNDFSKRAEAWIEYQCLNLNKNYDLKNTLHGPKFQRIYEYVYKIRLAELKQHAQRLERHKLAIKTEIKILKDAGINKQVEFEQVINDYVKLLPDYKKRAVKAETSVHLEQQILQLTRLKVMYAKKLQEVIESYSNISQGKIDEINAINAEYLKCLKLFTEGGNYSVVEVKKFKGIFNKIAKSMKKDITPVIKKLKQRFLKESNVLDVKEKPTLDILIQHRDELKFKENTTNEVLNVQNRIKEITYEMKLKMATIRKVFEELVLTADVNRGSMLYLNEFSQNCDYLRDAFKSVKDILVQVHPFKLKPELFIDNNNWSNVSILKSRLENELGGGDYDFNMVLFEKSFNKESEDYIGRIIEVLYNSLYDLQTMAKAFYGTHKDFVRKGIFSDLVSHMLELLSRFVYYELQCEEVWLNTAMEYILSVEKVLQFMRSYYVNSLQSYVNGEINAFKIICHNYIQNVRAKHNEIDENFRNLHKQLKALHGHPKNSALLEVLEAERMNLTELAQAVQIENSENYEILSEEIRANWQIFVDMLFKKENDLKSNLDGYITLIMDENAMLELIKDKIEYFSTIISSEYLNDNNNNTENYSYIELNNKLNDFKKGIKLTSDSLDRYSDNISRFGEIINNVSCVSSLQIQSISSGSIEYSHVNIMDFMQLYQDQQGICFKKLQFTKDVNILADKWNEKWENDLERIKKLYTVKYEQIEPNSTH